MSSFTIEDLKDAMRACAGEDDDLDLSGDLAGTTFEELGLDSLAVLELTALVSRRFEVTLPEDDMAGIEAPLPFLAEVQGRLPARAA